MFYIVGAAVNESNMVNPQPPNLLLLKKPNPCNVAGLHSTNRGAYAGQQKHLSSESISNSTAQFVSST